MLALEGVVFLLPHARNLPDHFVPFRARGGGVVDVEGGDFVAACAPPCAEFKAAFQKMIQHGDLFGTLHRVVDPWAEIEDARSHMDALGHSAEVAGECFVARKVAVFRQSVVLSEPDILPVVLVGALDHFYFLHEGGVLRLWVVRLLARQIPLNEKSEFHLWQPPVVCG